MKKILLPAALALVAVVSWASYPKAPEPSGYMMVIGSYTPDYSITIISPTGETTNQLIDLKKFSPKQRALANRELHKAEIHKINELKQTGWKVISTSMQPNGFVGTGDNVYLLEK